MTTKKCQEFSETFSFDEAISQAGYGRFHYKLFSVCALCILCVGFQNGLSSYVYSAAQCDLNFQSKDLGLLNVAFLLGGTLSAFVWGMIADVNGRRKVLIVTMILNSVITLGSSVTRTFTGAMICRFLNGVLIGCPGSVTFTYLAEFHSPKQQARSVCYSGIAFIAAWVLLPVLAVLILPLNFNIDIYGFNYTPWRMFMIILALPEVLAGLWLLKMPESPKFLHGKNLNDEALEILADIYCENTRNPKSKFPVKKLSNGLAIETKDPSIKCRGKVGRLLYGLLEQLKKLFALEIRVLTFLVCFIMFCNMFGYFGLGLWFPEFFIKFEEHYQLYPNESITLSDLSFSTNLNTTSNCEVTFDMNTFRNTLVVAASALVCNTLAGWLAGKISTKTLALATMVFGAISSFSIYFIRSSLGILAASSIFQASMATGNMVIGSIVVELFPTSIGAMALSTTICIGRIGAINSNLIFSMLLGKNNGAAIFMVSGVLLLGTVLCFAVPSNKKLQKSKNNKEVEAKNEISIISGHEQFNLTIQNA